jgi:signal transduction histidine kinase
MRGRFRPPALAVAVALLGLIGVLATLQYRWLGRISDAERERMTATLGARANAFAQDFDRELTLAYMLFQVEPGLPGTDLPAQTVAEKVGGRYERWQATARYPKLIREVYVASRDTEAPATLQRFNPRTRDLEAIEWPETLTPIRTQIGEAREEKTANGSMVVRTITPAVWEQVPAIVVPNAPASLLLINSPAFHGARLSPPSSLSYIVLALDRQVMTGEVLPALASHHFRDAGDDVHYQVAVVEGSAASLIYQSTPDFAPKAETKADANAELFQVRPQEFPQMAADVRRFNALSLPPGVAGTQTLTTFSMPVDPNTGAAAGKKAAGVIVRESLSTVQGQGGQSRDRAWVAAFAGTRPPAAAKWRLLIKHPAGSLETAISSARRRNLAVSMSILGVLAASMLLMVASMRRSQELARQQMEFVATVSHELRTPLAVVRAAGDNLAEGVIHDDDQVRKYGELVRSEGRRLTEMVEQILEFAGIHSGQRTLNVVPIKVDALIEGVLRGSATLIENAGLELQVDIPPDLPPVAGDEPALQRVFQNLVGNAIKYGAGGGWIGVDARRSGAEVSITVSDRGIGISPGDQERIFEPFYRAAEVVAAQVQGAGLGLSLVQRIVQAHGGRIVVKSAKAAGSQFTVYLPVGREQIVDQTKTSTVGTSAAASAPPLS